MKKRILSLLLCMIMATSTIPVAVYAEGVETMESEESEESEETIEEENAAEDVTEASAEIWEEPEEIICEEKVGIGCADNDELFAGYVDALFEMGDGLDASCVFQVGTTLSGNAREIYDQLKPMICEIAEGKRTSTILKATVSERINTGDQLKLEASAAIDALLADCAYELYWYDKVNGSELSAQGGVKNTVTLKMCVSEAYAGANRLTTDVEKTAAAKIAVTNAQAIVTKYAGCSDWEKLKAYKDEICALTDYNESAVANAAYGDPWQMIHVFDQDPATQVVCEGYSKAFQYLVQESQFESGRIDSILVTGRMSGGLHMWNVVTMDDGERYIVDVTNCDEGSVGYPDGLFLAGVAGSFDRGYVYTGSSYFRVSYVYDSETKAMYSASQLTLSAHDYHQWGQGVETKAPGCLTAGNRMYTCEIPGCTAVKDEEIPAFGHSFDEGALVGEQVVYTCNVCGAEEITQNTMITQLCNVSGGVKLTWNKRTDAYQYAVYYKTGVNGSWKKAATTKSTTYTKKSLKSGTTYSFYIKCLNKSGKSMTGYQSRSKSICYRSAPVLSSAGKTKKGVTVSWKSVSGVSRYIVYCKMEGEAWSEAETQTAEDLSVVFTNCISGTKYVMTVACLDDNGNVISGRDTKGKTVTYVSPSEIGEVTCTAAKTMTVRWELSEDALGYQIEYSTSSSFKKGNKTVTITDPLQDSVTVKKLTAGKKYYVRVRCYIKTGSTKYYSAWSDAVLYTIPTEIW